MVYLESLVSDTFHDTKGGPPQGGTPGRPSDKVQKKIKNYAGIFRYIMRKTHWIMWEI